MDSKYSFINSKSPLKANGSNFSSNFAVKRKLQSPQEQVNGNKIFKYNNSNSNNQANNNNAPSASSNNGNHALGSGLASAKNVLNRMHLVEEQRKSLPVYQCRVRLVQEVRKADTLLIMGETGSGKTTQIPQFLLSAGFGGVIAVTQPRRVAAITVAKRVAQEHGSRLGEVVGYTVRFEDCTSPQTKIRFMTDGTLLREALADRMLRHYAVIMLDEAHERTVNTDVLFGIVKEAQKQRKQRCLPALKIIVTSATMDIDHFGKYFGVRGMYLEGRTHPVKVMHAKEKQSDYLHAALVTLFDIHRNAPPDHDVLVFLTGQEEIEAMAHQIRQIAKNNDGLPGVRVFTLYAQMPQNKQLECFIPSSGKTRKIVLATNIAETSITIPGIRCVVDCGFVKRRIYNPGSGLDILRVVRISQAQAWQRCGRAGRDAAGTCYRTFTQAEMDAFEQMPKPEILRSNICSVVLQLLALGVDCRSFDFMDKPSPEAIDSACKQLAILGAIRHAGNVTELTHIGRQMAQFPLPPQYSKLLLSAPGFGCMQEMLSLVAVMASENIFINSVEKRELASLAHAKFQSKHGDHLTLLNVFSAFQKTDKPKLWCHDNFLNTRNLQYASEVRKQLQEIAERMHLVQNSCDGNHDQVRKCLLAGLFENIAELQRDNFYMTLAGRQRAKIHPSSVFHGKYRPDYIIYSEIVLTERSFLRQITEINAEWIGEVVPNYAHLNRIKSMPK